MTSVTTNKPEPTACEIEDLNRWHLRCLDCEWRLELWDVQDTYTESQGHVIGAQHTVVAKATSTARPPFDRDMEVTIVFSPRYAERNP